MFRVLTSVWRMSLHVNQIWLLVEARNSPAIKLQNKDGFLIIKYKNTCRGQTERRERGWRRKRQKWTRIHQGRSALVRALSSNYRKVSFIFQKPNHDRPICSNFQPFPPQQKATIQRHRDRVSSSLTVWCRVTTQSDSDYISG